MLRRKRESAPSLWASLSLGAAKSAKNKHECPLLGRPAYTLLEVILAAFIGVLLMSALYVAVDLQLRHAQSARRIVDQSTLARALINRISGDLGPSLGPADPSRYRISSSQGSGASPNGASGGASTARNGSSSSGAASSSSPAASGSAASGTSSPGQSSSSVNSNSSTYNFTVQGDSSQLTLYVNRYPRDLMVTTGDSPPPGSNIRRISYWLAGNGVLGLARQELRLITSDAAATMLPDIPDDANYVIAPEVRSLAFSYYDGTNWRESWDGNQTGSDGKTPIGPPQLIAVTMDIADTSSGTAGGDAKVKTYRHVIAIATANSANQQNTGGQ